MHESISDTGCTIDQKAKLPGHLGQNRHSLIGNHYSQEIDPTVRQRFRQDTGNHLENLVSSHSRIGSKLLQTIIRCHYSQII